MSRLVPLSVVALSAVLLSACGTGLQAKTYSEVGRQDGARADLGDLSVRNLHVTPPLSGSTIPLGDPAVLQGVLVNTGDSGDALVSATSEVAASAVLQDKGAVVTSVPVPARGTSGTTWSLVLNGLTRDLAAGTYVSVTLTFQKAARVTVQVPVRAGDNGLGDRQAEQDPYGAE